MSKISIIVPTYNAENYLHQCIDSLIKQTYRNVEIICINDGSRDKSLEILKEYELLDNRIIVIDQQNKGLSGARNKGIEVSTGNYIMFVDSDDWIDLTTCKKSLEFIEKFNAEVAIFPYIREYENLSKPKKILSNKEYEKYSGNYIKRVLYGPLKEELQRPENLDSLSVATCKLYKTEVIKEKKIEFIDTRKIGTEDLFFNIEVFNNVQSVVYINEYLYHYRRDNCSSLTRTYKPNLQNQWKTLYQLMFEEIKINNLSNEYYLALNNRISLSILGLGINVTLNKHSHLDKIKEIKLILNDETISKSLEQLDLKYLKIHWKLFYYFGKKKKSTAVYLILLIIEKIRKNINK